MREPGWDLGPPRLPLAAVNGVTATRAAKARDDPPCAKDIAGCRGIHMRRTQLLLTPDLHRRAAEVARARRLSLGSLVREALADYLARSGDTLPKEDAIDAILLAEPFDDPAPDAALSVDIDHYLYGAPRRSKRKR
jgi:hypothetical protein